MKSTKLSRGPLRRALLVCLLSAAAPFSSALESDKDQPIFVEADGAEINDRTGVSVYSGNVVVTQGTIRLDASEVTITQKQGKTSHIKAVGTPVKFQQQVEGKEGLTKARARQADYHFDSEILNMTGDAILLQGKDSFSSDRIRYDRVKGQVKAGSQAKGKQRVRISIQPKPKEDTGK